MRTTVSDILLFQKCPYAWYVRTVNKKMSTTPKPAQDYGTTVHKEFQNYLSGNEELLYPELAALPKVDFKIVQSIKEQYNIISVEKPISVDVGGHTIDGTPDGVLEDKLYADFPLLWQLKTSGANKAHHIEIVRFSLHECMYGIGVGSIQKPVLTTILGRYIRTSKSNRAFYLNKVQRTIGDIEAARQYVVRICNQMEEMTLGKNAEGWQSPPSCIDWITGSRCDYFGHCHYGEPLNGPKYKDAPDRYAKGESPEEE